MGLSHTWPSAIFVIFKWNQGIYIQIKTIQTLSSNTITGQWKKKLFIHSHGGDAPLLLSAFPLEPLRKSFPSISPVSGQFFRQNPSIWLVISFASIDSQFLQFFSANSNAKSSFFCSIPNGNADILQPLWFLGFYGYDHWIYRRLLVRTAIWLVWNGSSLWLLGFQWWY